MPIDAPRIDELVLRVPGLTREQAHLLARSVSEKVYARIPLERAPMHLGRLDLRLTLPSTLPVEELAERIASAVVAQLDRNGG